MYHRNLIFSIKPQIFELKCVFSYFRLKTHITLLLPVYVHSWEQRKVREVTDRYDNLRIPVAASLRVAGTTPYYGANGIQDYVDGYTHDGEFILVAEDGANDLKNYPVKCVKGRIWVNNHAHVLQGKYDCADNQFLAYAISQADIESLLVGGGRAKLNAETLMGIDLLLPNKAEQIRIGKYLAQLDNLITLHQCKCQIDGCRFQSPLAITWEQRKLSDCAGFRRGSFPQPYGNKDWYDGEGAMPFVQVADVSDDMKLVDDTKQKISKLAQPMSVCAEEGSVLVTLQGSIGRVAIMQYKAFVDRTVLIFDKYNADIDKTFWAYIIKEKFIEEARKAPGGTIKTITKEVLSDFDLMLPSYDEQKMLGKLLHSLDHLITLHQRKPVVVNSSSTMNALPNQHLYFQVLE